MQRGCPWQENTTLFFFGHAKLFPTRVHLWFKLYSLLFSDLLPKLSCVIAYTGRTWLAGFMLDLGSFWELGSVQISQMPISASVPDSFTAVSISCLTSSPQPCAILWAGWDLWELFRPVGVNRHSILVIVGQAWAGGPESLLNAWDTRIEVCTLASLHAPSMTWLQHFNMQNHTQTEAPLFARAESSTHPLPLRNHKHTSPSWWRLINKKGMNSREIICCRRKGAWPEEKRSRRGQKKRSLLCSVITLFWDEWFSDK